MQEFPYNSRRVNYCIVFNVLQSNMSGSSNNRIFRNHKIHGYSADISISSSHRNIKFLEDFLKGNLKGFFM